MVSLWLNQLRTNKSDFESFLDRVGAKYTLWVEADFVYLVENLDTGVLTETEEYLQGWFYIMNPSSVLAVLALDLKPNLRVLDIAAAPGGKTALMASLMGNSGEIVANDISPDRIFKMKANFKRLGVTNVQISKMYGEMIWRTKANSFDRVLADVPCSMDERVDASLIDKRVKQLVPRQQKLIWSAFTSLKIGGIMVYSTCTSSHEENENIVKWLEEQEPNLCRVLEMRRVEPTKLMGTFFLAKITKE